MYHAKYQINRFYMQAPQQRRAPEISRLPGKPIVWYGVANSNER